MSNNVATRKSNLSDTKRALLEKRLRGEANVPATMQTITRRPDTESATLAYAQERLWFLHQLDPHSAAYNMVNAVRLYGTLDIAALEHSLNVMVNRHHVLRARFTTRGGQPCQQIVSAETIVVSTIDLQPYSDADLEARVEQEIRQQVRLPFDLEDGPLLRVVLIKLTTESHILVLTIPHILIDEWSNEVFWREMTALYKAYQNGTQVDLSDLPIQYADFAYWQKQWLERGTMETQLAYWKQQLGDDPAHLQLPTDYLRPSRQTFDGDLLSLALPSELTSALNALNQKMETTMFMTLLTAFMVLLHRYSGQADILVGTPIANRNRGETKDLIGLFLNTLVMRGNLADNPDFAALLQQTRHMALDAYAHQDLPFEKLVDELQPTRDPGYNPLFQVMFVYQKDATEALEFPGLKATRVPVNAGVAKFDLTLFVNETGNDLTAAIEFNTDLFAPETISRMLGHFRMLLEGVAENPQRAISDLPLLTDIERQQILTAWNDTETPFPQDACIHHYIETYAAQTPDAIAIRYEDIELTYDTLNRRANQLAHRLMAHGVGSNTPVGVCMERSPEMLVAILGILKAGGAYVPLDPDYPVDRISFVLRDTGMSTLITTQSLVDRLPTHDSTIICLDADWSSIAMESLKNPAKSVSAQDMAYIIYTSGSTGQPKGVMISHQNIVHSTTARFTYYPEAFDSFLLLSSFAFDSSLVGIFWSLCAGATLVLPHQGSERDVHAIIDLIARHQISHMLCLPALYNLILTYGDARQLQSLRAVIVAGEACPANLSDRHYNHLPNASLYNEYGPTEGTVWSTVYKFPTEPISGPIPIGRPITNMQTYILDTYQQPVPIGVPGELYIGGAGIAQGYLNRPELTAERFLPILDLRFTIYDWDGNNRKLEIANRKLYRTGDLARWNVEGQIEFLGRVDNQIKLRGYRIELSEIEAELAAHPALQDVAVIVTDGGNASWQATDDVHALMDQLAAMSDTEADQLLSEIEKPL